MLERPEKRKEVAHESPWEGTGNRGRIFGRDCSYRVWGVLFDSTTPTDRIPLLSGGVGGLSLPRTSVRGSDSSRPSWPSLAGLAKKMKSSTIACCSNGLLGSSFSIFLLAFFYFSSRRKLVLAHLPFPAVQVLPLCSQLPLRFN